MPSAFSADAARRGVPGDVRQRRRVSEQHARTHVANGSDEAIELGIGHLERRQQAGAQHGVAQPAHAVLRVQFDRRSPDHDFAVANVHAPPARRPPFGRDVVADPLLAEEEHQRFAARPAGVGARQSGRGRRFQRLGVCANVRLGQERQALEIGERSSWRAGRSRCAGTGRGSTARCRWHCAATLRVCANCAAARRSGGHHCDASRAWRTATVEWPLRRSCRGKIAPDTTRV